MSLRQLSTRIELSFWQIMINLLSGSKPLQSLIRWFYLEILPAIRDFFKNLNRQRLIRTAIFGLGFGFAEGTWLAATSMLWFFAKTAFFIFVFLWFRATFPRYRYDQIMRLGWKVLLPTTTMREEFIPWLPRALVLMSPIG